MKKTYWEPVQKEIWQGRDDSKESPIAKRVFQTIIQETSFIPQNYENQIALLGFMCDEGVRINKGRMGAREAPDALRKALANFAVHDNKYSLVDFGNVICDKDELSVSQEIFTSYIVDCLKSKMKTIVLGGGHETAFTHGLGVYKANKDKIVGIINFDAHFDIRINNQASSGTPFKQLADYCEKNNRPFHYLCVGASSAANTSALLHTAKDLNVNIIWDLDCYSSNLLSIWKIIENFINSVDIVYLTIDLDVLPQGSMFAVSAPSALGVESIFLLNLIKNIIRTNKVCSTDIVEFNPFLDRDMLCARVAARFVWQIFNEFQHN